MFTLVQRSSSNSALGSQIDQTALDVDLLDQLLALQRGSHSGVCLSGGDGVLGGDVCGHLQTCLHLAVHLHGDLHSSLHTLGFLVGRPRIVGQLLIVAVAQLLPQLLGHVGSKGVQQLHQRLKLGLGGAAVVAKGETFDKVLGLELGADDYMVKPFDAKEVVARIKAVLRRCQTTSAAAESTEGVIEFDNLRLDMNSYELRVKGKVVEAPPKELELLNCLASHPNRVYTRDQLLDEVWGFEYYGDSRTIDVHVKRLREKLAGASDKWELKTVWGVGYKFEVRQ